MTELNPFSRDERKKSLDMNDNYTESGSENDYPMVDYQSFNSLDTSSYPESTKKRFPGYLVKSIYLPELFLDQKVIEDYKCGLCENVCEEAVKAECKCGKLFCKNCLEFYFKEKEEKCPICEMQTNGKIIEAEAEDMFIKSQKMKCGNPTCKWEGECRAYKEHKDIFCEEETVNCPNHGCVIKLTRKDIVKHLNECECDQITCQKCNSKYLKKDKELHKSECLMEEMNCPYNCGKKFLKKDFEHHQNKECANFKIECPYKKIGCKDVFKKKDEKKRLDEEREKHMTLLMEKILAVEQNFYNLEQSFKNMENDILLLKDNNNNSNANNNFININHNNETDITLLSNKRKRNNSINQEESDDSRSIEEEKSGNYLPNININSNNDSNPEESKIPFPLKDQEKEKDELYEFLKSDKNYFYIKNNVIEACDLKGTRHIFVFFNKKYEIPKNSEKTYIIKFKLLSNVKSLYIGLCDRKLLEENKYEFVPHNKSKEKNSKKTNNGLYYLNTNKVAWNCNNTSQCKNLKINDENNLGKEGNTFEFIIKPIECELEIKYNFIPIIKFNDVRCFRSSVFSPVLIFLRNCKVETTFMYK